MSTVLASRPDLGNLRQATRQDLELLRRELKHEVRLLKLDIDHRFAVLDVTIDSLQRQLSHVAATHRQCVLALLGAMVIASFCVFLAFVSL